MLPIVQKFYKEVVQDMDNNKLDTITNLFEEKEIRSIWNSEKEDYFFSVVDVVSALTDSNDPAHYWRTLKSRMLQEGNETVTNCDTFKLKAKDGKMIIPGLRHFVMLLSKSQVLYLLQDFLARILIYGHSFQRWYCYC